MTNNTCEFCKHSRLLWGGVAPEPLDFTPRTIEKRFLWWRWQHTYVPYYDGWDIGAKNYQIKCFDQERVCRLNPEAIVKDKDSTCSHWVNKDD